MHKDEIESSFPRAFIGTNSIGLNFNSRRLARRAEYMDVFCNPVTLQYLKSLDPGSKACRDDGYMDGLNLALNRLSVHSRCVSMKSGFSFLCALGVFARAHISITPLSGLRF